MAADLRAKIEEQVRSTHVLMYGKTTCPFCKKVIVRVCTNLLLFHFLSFVLQLKRLFEVHCVDVTYVWLDELDKNGDPLSLSLTHTHTHVNFYLFPTEPGLMARYQDVLNELTGQRTVPNVFINGKHMGGSSDVMAMHSHGDLARSLVASQMERDNAGSAHSYNYDLIVIGGGSGGLSCAKVEI